MSREDRQRESDRPPRINGPAFLVFGLFLAVFGIATRSWLVAGVGCALVAIGVLGIVALRRYEREHGIAQELPGASHHDTKADEGRGSDGDSDPGSGDNP